MHINTACNMAVLQVLAGLRQFLCHPCVSLVSIQAQDLWQRPQKALQIPLLSDERRGSKSPGKAGAESIKQGGKDTLREERERESCCLLSGLWLYVGRSVIEQVRFLRSHRSSLLRRGQLWTTIGTNGTLTWPIVVGFMRQWRSVD